MATILGSRKLDASASWTLGPGVGFDRSAVRVNNVFEIVSELGHGSRGWTCWISISGLTKAMAHFD